MDIDRSDQARVKKRKRTIYLSVGVLAAIAALIAVIFLYRRRKVRKPVNHGYCTFVVPSGGDPTTDGMHSYRRKPLD